MDAVRQMQRLEPFRRFLFLVILGHLLLAGMVWWWMEYKQLSTPAAIDHQSLTWMVTSDIKTEAGRSADNNAAETSKPVPNRSAPTLPTGSQPLVSSASSPIVIPGSSMVTRTEPTPASPPAPAPVAQAPANKEQKVPEEKPVPKAIPWPKDRPPPGMTAEVTPNVGSTTPVPGPAATAASPSAPPVGEGVSRFINVSRNDAKGQKIAGLDEVDDSVREGFLSVWTPPKVSDVPDEMRSVYLDVSLGRGGQLVSFRFSNQPADEALKRSVLDAANRLTKINKPLPDLYISDRYSVQVHFHAE